MASKKSRGQLRLEAVVALGLDVEWIAGVGWCGPDWEKAEEIDRTLEVADAD